MNNTNTNQIILYNNNGSTLRRNAGRVNHEIVYGSVNHEVVYGNVTPTPQTSENISCSYDFLNLFKHCVKNAYKNSELPSKEKLYVLRSKSLRESSNITDSDQWVMDKMNKLSLFKPNIKNYHQKTQEVLERRHFPTFFYDMQEHSRDITSALLKTVYYTQGCEGISLIQSNLDKIIHNGSFNPDCLKMYNLLIYSSPFILCDVFLDGTNTRAMFLHTPFELLATNLHTFIATFPFEDLSFPLRIQMQLENAIPNGSWLQDAYNAMLNRLYQRGFAYARYGIYQTPSIIARYAFLYPSITSNVTEPESRSLELVRQPATQEELEIMVTLITDIILQL